MSEILQLPKFLKLLAVLNNSAGFRLFLLVLWLSYDIFNHLL